MPLTHFGFKTVTSEEKTAKVRAVFERVAHKYDLMNDLMSLGVHRSWKKDFISMLPTSQGQQILDVAGGTGDIALKLQQTYPHLGLDIIVCDLTPDMLMVGQDRALNSGYVQNIHWVCGNAESLPIPDESIDLYTIAFGLRNVTHIEKALSEAVRVLKPGGTFACLEFSNISNPIGKRLYDFYSFSFLPWLGEVIVQDRDSYQYLVESIRRFPAQEQLANMMRHVGMQQVSWQNWLGGISCIHSGKK
jgi:demethylmenaquinone methyltransferase / 2-methoxy-6-polyprenyl-1,4-benzoquinol methylase